MTTLPPVDPQTDSGSTRSLVEEELRSVLASPYFRTSKRCSAMLRYIVQHALDEPGGSIKERIIGAEVFERNPDYDTTVDPVVRATAGEIRKRLAQYSAEHLEAKVQIMLQAGSYLPVIQNRAQISVSDAVLVPLDKEAAVRQTASLPKHRSRRWQVATAVAFCIIVLFVVVALRHRQTELSRQSKVETFWSGFLQSKEPTLVCVGEVPVGHGEGLLKPLNKNNLQEFTVSQQHIMLQDGMALSRITNVLYSHGTHPLVQISPATSSDDISKSNVVLVSGFDNEWTMRFLKTFRYNFVRQEQMIWIEDRSQPQNRPFSVDLRVPYMQLDHDFAIIARFHDKASNHLVIIVAGLSFDGTLAASQMLTDERSLTYLQETLHLDHFGDFEAVVDVPILLGKPSTPTIVAFQRW